MQGLIFEKLFQVREREGYINISQFPVKQHMNEWLGTADLLLLVQPSSRSALIYVPLLLWGVLSHHAY